MAQRKRISDKYPSWPFWGTIIAVIVSALIFAFQNLSDRIDNNDNELSQLRGEIFKAHGEMEHIKARQNRISIRQLEFFKILVPLFQRLGLTQKSQKHQEEIYKLRQELKEHGRLYNGDDKP